MDRRDRDRERKGKRAREGEGEKGGERERTHWVEDRVTCEMVAFVYFFFDQIYMKCPLEMCKVP